MVNSRIHECSVAHTRTVEAKHTFQYNVLYHQFDLDELETLRDQVFGFSLNKFNATSLKENDYLIPNQKGSLRSRVLKFVLEQGVSSVVSVHLITTVRLLGYTFNPVCFFLCYDSCQKLVASVVEVRNTFGEKHLYFLKDFTFQKGVYQASHQKLFHVSPFFDLKGDYEFSFRLSEDNFRIDIDLMKNHKLALKTYLQTKSSYCLSTKSHWAMFLKYPMTLFLTVPRILYEAAMLYYKKKVSFFKKPVPQSSLTYTLKKPSLMQRLMIKAFQYYFKSLQKGRLIVVLPNQQRLTFGDVSCSKPVELKVKDYQFFNYLILRGSVGFGEAYMDGLFQTDDLDTLLMTLASNQELLQKNFNWFSSVSRKMNQWKHKLRENSIFQTKKNISDHYDLSNDLYETFLDSSMMYSAGLFPSESTTLFESQSIKRKKIIDMLDLSPGQRVLEIGSGWGGMAIEMARLAHVHVDSATLSEEQKSYADNWIKSENLEESVQIHLKDYRMLRGVYDRIVSIEMLEAVGHEYFKDFFKTIDRLLKPGGKVVLQVITIPHNRYESYKNSCDFIQKHIFPGGFLPSVEALKEVIHENTDFVMSRIDSIGLHYAETIKHWKSTFLNKKSQVQKLGFDDAFIRKFHYYFSYCEAGFRHHLIDTVQVVLERKGEVRV